MDLDLTDEQEMLRDATERFIQDSGGLVGVRQLAEGGDDIKHPDLGKAADLGWFAMLVPEEQGGGSVSGQGLLDAAIVAEERGRFVLPGAFVPTNVVAYALANTETNDQHAEVLTGLIAGTSRATWALADSKGAWEPDAGVRATRRGSDYVLSGAKGLVEDAAEADWILVTAGSDVGLVQLLLPADTAGVSVHQVECLDLSRRMSELRFDDVVVPASALIDSGGAVEDLVDRQLQIAAVLTMAESIGAMGEIFATVVQYSKDRIAFGRPIGSFQAVKHLLADTSLLLECSRGMAVAAAYSAQRDDDDAAETVSAAKAFIGDSGITLSQNCFQVFGGIGYTWEHENHLYLRRLATDAALYGDATFHRERICRIRDL
jgi:alkylation response protein AidB-like acyl-CoA dehydrogenase